MTLSGVVVSPKTTDKVGGSLLRACIYFPAALC